jgi:hypothetical protein
MSTGTTKSPNLPIAPLEYDPLYQQQLNNALRLYFAQLDNPGPSVMSTQRLNGKVIAALNFSQYNTTTNTQLLSVPTQAEINLLRVGDIYVDTSAGNVLKVKV